MGGREQAEHGWGGEEEDDEHSTFLKMEEKRIERAASAVVKMPVEKHSLKTELDVVVLLYLLIFCFSGTRTLLRAAYLQTVKDEEEDSAKVIHEKAGDGGR